MKKLFILLALIFTIQFVYCQSPTSEAVQANDTIGVLLLFSQCDICRPETDYGYIVGTNKGTKEKPQFELISYLDRNRNQIKKDIIWMVKKR
ncbi:MAG: hypothetical protein IPO78_17535 [Saprospiraceae bacterium]|nr:hypothetical protein [Saprospiraceae bacterium]